MPVPQKTFSLVEQASCLLQNLIKMNFARGIIATPVFGTDSPAKFCGSKMLLSKLNS